MGPLTTKFARIDPGPSQTFGLIGAAISVVGAALVVIAFTAADWFQGATSVSPAHFSDVHDALRQPVLNQFAASPASAYFSWLGWVLLIAAILTALVAAVPTIGTGFRFIAPIVAAAAIVLTLLAIRLFDGNANLVGTSAGGYGDYLQDARAGFYLALAGFLLIGAGGALGPQRKRR